MVKKALCENQYFSKIRTLTDANIIMAGFETLVHYESETGQNRENNRT